MEYQIVLVDGPQDCGRSIAAKWIAHQLGAKLYIGTAETQAWEYVQFMRPALDKIHPVVIENSWYNSKVRDLLGMPATVKAVHRRMLNRLALTRDAHHILTLSDLRTYMQCIAKMRQTSNTNVMINAAVIHDVWMRLRSDLPLYYAPKPESLCLASCIDWSLSKYEDGPGAGAWRFGNILIVGDRPGPSKQPYHIDINAPFVSMSGVGCSEWLADHLNEHNISEQHLYWINCRDQEGEFVSSEFESRLEPTSVIALGRHAEQWCNDNDIQSIYIEHPQAHMRFMSHKPYILGDTLRRLIDDKTYT